MDNLTQEQHQRWARLDRSLRQYELRIAEDNEEFSVYDDGLFWHDPTLIQWARQHVVENLRTPNICAELIAARLARLKKEKAEKVPEISTENIAEEVPEESTFHLYQKINALEQALFESYIDHETLICRSCGEKMDLNAGSFEHNPHCGYVAVLEKIEKNQTTGNAP